MMRPLLGVKRVIARLFHDLDGADGTVTIGGELQVQACCGGCGQLTAGEVVVAGVDNLGAGGKFVDAGWGGIVDIDDL